jgi:hypothetical protein
MEAYEKAIERSKIKRVAWKKIFGKSLMEHITEEFAMGYSKVKIVNRAMDRVVNFRNTRPGEYNAVCKGMGLGKVLENLKINVSARIAEMSIEDGVRNRVKRGN